MKCVKTSNGKIVRVRDEVAARLVEKPGYSYCPKWEWKDQKGVEYKGERHGLA